ncbi:hypothetical protein ATK30_7072 [Amycolatopsis echigonensis]|uniref:Lipoprotein n=1 Tax=Amycolatopsis echigonensis TaxID=2576905 RepID=A0A2N3WQH2_9PSEU|nr:hypothetical protein [Amycolatopsis niigatensis]PKV96136.1 hypothetical protein ATK30_7072 [Amycolatopsis niigatensis]
MTRRAVAAIALALALAGCAGNPPAQHAVAGPAPTSRPSPEPAPSTTTTPTATTPAASTPAKATSTPKTTASEAKRRDPATSPGCGQRAVDAGKFNPRCKEYQGYLDPGGSGRPKTSGEIQHEYLCQQGYLPPAEC